MTWRTLRLWAWGWAQLSALASRWPGELPRAAGQPAALPVEGIWRRSAGCRVCVSPCAVCRVEFCLHAASQQSRLALFLALASLPWWASPCSFVIQPARLPAAPPRAPANSQCGRPALLGLLAD